MPELQEGLHAVRSHPSETIRHGVKLAAVHRDFGCYVWSAEDSQHRSRLILNSSYLAIVLSCSLLSFAHCAKLSCALIAFICFLRSSTFRLSTSVSRASLLAGKGSFEENLHSYLSSVTGPGELSTTIPVH